MDDVGKLEEFIVTRVEGSGPHNNWYEVKFNLEELRELRELVQMAIVQRLCEYSPIMFEPIFKDKL